MNRKWKILLAGLMLAALSGAAAAHERVSFGISIGVPGAVVVAPAPVYYAPPPPVVYYTPAPVYYGPPPWAFRHNKHWNKHQWRGHWRR